MNNLILEKFKNFRNQLFHSFKYRADATTDLIDALAGQESKDSVVKISLSPLFRREYTSLTDVVDSFSRFRPKTLPSDQELKTAHAWMTKILIEQCPLPTKKKYIVAAVDCTSIARIHSDKLEDRGFVHTPAPVPGQKPVTVGHQYSFVGYLPERLDSLEPTPAIPLSTRRVKTEENGAIVGMEQLKEIFKNEKLKNILCVSVADTAYSFEKCIKMAAELNNWVHVSRLRSNRILYLPPVEGKNKRGRPRIYGNKWSLGNPGKPDEEEEISCLSKTGMPLKVYVERWRNRIDKMGQDQLDSSTEKVNIQGGINPTSYSLDVVRITATRPDGTSIFAKPLWVSVTGDRRLELSLSDIAESYFRRFDIEHFFRFCKQNLLLNGFQTPDVRHEENWCWICILSYMMLWWCRYLAKEIKYHWEKKEDLKSTGKAKTLSQVQRDYERIIKEIGTPACDPKPRGKSPGRIKGAVVPKRENKKVIKKGEKKPKTKEKLAA